MLSDKIITADLLLTDTQQGIIYKSFSIAANGLPFSNKGNIQELNWKCVCCNGKITEILVNVNKFQ